MNIYDELRNIAKKYNITCTCIKQIPYEGSVREIRNNNPDNIVVLDYLDLMINKKE